MKQCLPHHKGSIQMINKSQHSRNFLTKHVLKIETPGKYANPIERILISMFISSQSHGEFKHNRWMQVFYFILFLFFFIFSKYFGEGNGTPLQYSCLENPMEEEPGGLQSTGLRRVGHSWVTSLSLFTFMHWRRKWQLTPVFLPGESQGQRSLMGCLLWGLTESDTTEAT